MKIINGLMEKLESKVPFHGLMALQISEASVGWHIAHSLLTLNSIIDALTKSNPQEYKSAFDIRRSVVMLLGKFPRGRIKAPKAVRPSSDINLESLQQGIHGTTEKIKILEQLSPHHYFKHPFLGDFKLKPAIKFMAVHTNHHLHIINDILKSTNIPS